MSLIKVYIQHVKVLLLPIVACAVASCSSMSQSVTIVVSNPTDLNRTDEVVEIPLTLLEDRLKTDGSEKFVVCCCDDGVEAPSQITHDGKLIFQRSINGGESTQFEITNGEPQTIAPKVFGAQYTNRKDDFAWENDRIAFRIYGPALQALGEKSYGSDIWVKSVSDLIVDYRYDLALNPATLRKLDSLRGCDMQAARALSNSISFHTDHGNGMDQYTVGPTLGAATAALMHNDSIIYPYCYKNFEILDEGPLRFTVKLTYNPIVVGKDEDVVETRTISIDAGGQFNKTTLHYSNLSSAAPIISGIIMGEPEGKAQYTTSKEGGYAAYATPPEVGKEEMQGTIYIATIFGDATTKAEPYYFSPEESAKYRINKSGYAAVFGNYQPDEIFTYHWGAAWSKYNFSSYDEWVEYVDNYAQRVGNPLKIDVK